MENYEVGRNEIVAGTVSPSYILPIHGLQRLEKIMDEYVGGISAHYTTNEPMLTRGIELLGMLREDLAHIGAERKSVVEGKSVSGSVDIGGSRVIKNKNK